LLVANLAPQRIATAAIKTAGTAAGLIEQAGSQGRIGRHKNSAQAMLLALQASCVWIQLRNWPCADEPATTA